MASKAGRETTQQKPRDRLAAFSSTQTRVCRSPPPGDTFSGRLWKIRLFGQQLPPVSCVMGEDTFTGCCYGLDRHWSPVTWVNHSTLFQVISHKGTWKDTGTSGEVWLTKSGVWLCYPEDSTLRSTLGHTLA